jgi:hypothetical protein
MKLHLAALVALPLLAAPALAVTATPKVNAPVPDCTAGVTVDCETLHQAGFTRRG